MAEEKRYDVPVGEVGTYCKSCGRHIWFVPTESGKKMPIEWDGVPHWGRCTEAAAFRKKAKDEALEAQLANVELRWKKALERIPRPGGSSYGFPPDNSNDVVIIRMGYDFEPHGRASETWEDAWYIVIKTTGPYIKDSLRWQSAAKYRDASKPELSWMHFKGRTEEEAKARALEFLEWYVEQPIERSKP